MNTLMSPITPTQTEIIDTLFKTPASKDNTILFTAFNIPFTIKDLKTLKPKVWLNDEVINMWMNLLQVMHPSHYYFSSHFFTKLQKEGYDAVKRWTKNINLFKKSKLFIPINENKSHWTLIVVDLNLKKIQYYDSKLSDDSLHAKSIVAEYLTTEQHQKFPHHVPISWDDANRENIIDLPKQKNFCDCGVFVCTFAFYISRNKYNFDFSVKDISNKLRYKIASLLLNVKNILIRHNQAASIIQNTIRKYSIRKKKRKSAATKKRKASPKGSPSKRKRRDDDDDEVTIVKTVVSLL